MDTKRIPAAGDPFTSAPVHDDVDTHYSGLERLDDKPCGCWDGWHWLGVAVEDPDIADGAEFVVYERVACKRCSS